MRQSWALFERALDSNSCDTLVEEFLQLQVQNGTTMGPTEDGFRKSKIRWVHDHPIQDYAYSLVRNANINSFGVNVENFSECQFTEYDADYAGKYEWHHDVDWIGEKASDRKLSVVIQLTDPDEYEGGDFAFAEVQNPHRHQMRAKGTVLVFPSYLTHRVEEVTKGTRHSLVLWFYGPRWR